MHELDDALAGLGGGSVAVMLAVAVLLGLRHPTDPDHLGLAFGARHALGAF